MILFLLCCILNLESVGVLDHLAYQGLLLPKYRFALAEIRLAAVLCLSPCFSASWIRLLIWLTVVCGLHDGHNLQLAPAVPRLITSCVLRMYRVAYRGGLFLLASFFVGDGNGLCFCFSPTQLDPSAGPCCMKRES